MPKFDKPSEGSWTQHFPQLGTGPISYEDSISPEHYELERRAIFERTWLNVGRVEQLPRPGSYFTKDLDVARTSLIIARGLDGEVRAFHNICRHRGNKLVWQDYPDQETQGVGRQFTCKYHGWRYGTDGACTFVQQESEFFDFDKTDYGLVPVHLDVWEGFIFVNLDKGDAATTARLSGRVRRRPRRLPLRRHDPGAQVPRRRARQLEAVHRRVRRVLPRPRSALEAVHRGGSAQAPGLRIRGAALRLGRTPRDAVDVGRHGPAEGPQHGQAHRAGPAQRQLRSLGPTRHPRPRSPARRDQPVASQIMGARLVRVLPQLHDRGVGAGLVPDVSLLADGVQPPHVRRHPLLRATGQHAGTHASGTGRGDVQGVRAPGLQHPRGDPTNARVTSRHRVPTQRPGDHAPPPAPDGRRLRRSIPAGTTDRRLHVEPVAG